HVRKWLWQQRAGHGLIQNRLEAQSECPDSLLLLPGVGKGWVRALLRPFAQATLGTNAANEVLRSFVRDIARLRRCAYSSSPQASCTQPFDARAVLFPVQNRQRHANREVRSGRQEELARRATDVDTPSFACRDCRREVRA